MHSPVLFRDDHGNGLHLIIKSGPEKAELEKLVKQGGGRVCLESTEYSITFVPPEYEVTVDEELYSYRYIKDCCDQNKLLYLKPYRLNKQSKYPDDFKPIDVFLKYTTWKDGLQGKSFERFVLPFSLDDSRADSSISSDVTSVLPVQTSQLRQDTCMKDKEADPGQSNPSTSEAIPNSKPSSECHKMATTAHSPNKKKQTNMVNNLGFEFSDDELQMGGQSSNKEKDISSSEKPEDNEFRVAEAFSKSVGEGKRQSDNSSSENMSTVSDISEASLRIPSQKKITKVRKKRTSGLKRTNVFQSSDSEFSDGESLNKLEIGGQLENKEKESLSSQSHKGSAVCTRLKVAETFAKSIEERKGRRDVSSPENIDSFSDIRESPPVKKYIKVGRREYTESERRKILQYIKENNAYSAVKGREFWQKMEADKICPERTWQSLKEHFTKQIFPRIDQFGLTEKELQKYKMQESYATSSDTSSLDSVAFCGSKRRDYTNAEKLEIINFIIKYKAFQYVKGRELWQKMEAKVICPGRTWQSMKEHYTKQILPKIDKFNLPEDVVHRFKRI